MAVRSAINIDARVFNLRELDGFYVGAGKCVHITFEDSETISIDVFDSEDAAFEVGNIVGTPLYLNLRTGEVRLAQ